LDISEGHAAPLYIRDDEADALAAKVKALTGVRTKTDAVKAALLHELERLGKRAPLLERLAPVWAVVDAIGPLDDGFDMKNFTDEMWRQR
jgi:antitoxin VapB